MGVLFLFAGLEFVGFVLLEHLGAFMHGAHDLKTIATLLGFPMVIVLVNKSTHAPVKAALGTLLGIVALALLIQ
jgi:hypothetical protein